MNEKNEKEDKNIDGLFDSDNINDDMYGMSLSRAKHILSESEYDRMADVFVEELAVYKLKDSVCFSLDEGIPVAIDEHLSNLADLRVNAFYRIMSAKARGESV